MPQSTRKKACLLGIARSTLFYRKKKPAEDWHTKCRIEEVLREFPSYGHRRLALHLKLNKKRIIRIMRKYGIKPYRRRKSRWKKPKKQSVLYPNHLMAVTPSFPHHVWVADFTHLAFHDRKVSVATVMDVFTRDIVGLSVATRHGALLVTQALCAALHHHKRPHIFHSDNGVEYNTRSFRDLLVSLTVVISRSKKGCPWENGYQESFYDKFKVDLGDPNRFNTLGELVAEIYRTIHRYNTVRIHTALKMSPRQFAQKYIAATIQTIT